MDCRSCTLDDAAKARKAALTLLRTPGQLPEADRDKASACCDCYSKRMAEDATKRKGN